MMLYAGEVGFFVQESLDLLQQGSEDLVQGVAILRGRAIRKAVEEALTAPLTKARVWSPIWPVPRQVSSRAQASPSTADSTRRAKAF